MNYRHAYHAGNFADCMKHAVLVWLLQALARKPAPFGVLDTHAGAGRTVLDFGPAARTGEWRQGIARLMDQPAPTLDAYLSRLPTMHDTPPVYPGSPLLIRGLLRPDDRLTCCELQPNDAQALRRLFARDRQVSVHHRDGYEALRALLPFPQRRGLVLIDPPFEQPDEFTRLLDGLRTAYTRCPGHVLVGWYPIKGRAPVRMFQDALRASGMPDVVAAELLLREPADAARLNGCGLVIINPPYQAEDALPSILAALADRLGTDERGRCNAMTRFELVL